MALPGGQDPFSVRRSRREYGAELRAQIEAERQRKLAQNRDDLVPQPQGPAGARAPQPERRVPGGRLPYIRGAEAPEGRPRSANQNQRSSMERVKAEVEGSAERIVLEQELFQLTKQVQEILVGLEGRVGTLEKDTSSKLPEVIQMRDRVQSIELENAAMRAEQKTYAASERLMQLERDLTAKLHQHLEHVTSVESERVGDALQKLHAVQTQALEDRQQANRAQEIISSQARAISQMEERLQAMESLGLQNANRQSEDQEAGLRARSDLEVRVQELEAALMAVSVRGEQVAKDTGDAVKSLVEVSNASLLSQLQGAVNNLDGQMRMVQQELLQRGADLQSMTEAEGKARVDNLTQMSDRTSIMMEKLQTSIEEVKRLQFESKSDMQEQHDALALHVSKSLQSAETTTHKSLQRIDEAMLRTKSEMQEEMQKAVDGTEQTRGFLEEVVRAEIRGRMKGQQQLSQQIVDIEEALKGHESIQMYHRETHTMMKLLQAKAKAHSKSIKALGKELDSSKTGVANLQSEMEEEVRALASAIRASEEGVRADLTLQGQSSTDLLNLMGTRVSVLEEGRETILKKIYDEVDANRAADIERAKESEEKLSKVQKSIDQNVEMLQADLKVMQAGIDAMDHKFDRKTEELQGVIDQTARHLTMQMQDRLQEHVRTELDNVSSELRSDIAKNRDDIQRLEIDQREQVERIETNRKNMENKVKNTDAKIEDMSSRYHIDHKKVKDDLVAHTETFNKRVDALDEMMHNLRGQTTQNKAESLERDKAIDSKLTNLENVLMYAGSGVQAESALRVTDLTPRGDPVQQVKDLSQARKAGILGLLRDEIDGLKILVPANKKEITNRVDEIQSNLTETRKRQDVQAAQLGDRIEAIWTESKNHWNQMSDRMEKDSKLVWDEFSNQRAMSQRHLEEMQVLVQTESTRRQEGDSALERSLLASKQEFEARIDGEGGVMAIIREVQESVLAAEEKASLALQEEAQAREKLEVQAQKDAELQRERETAMEGRLNESLQAQSDANKLAQEKLLDGVLKVSDRVDELFKTASEMQKVQQQHSRDLKNNHAALDAAQGRQAKMVVSITDSHRRDIDRVCREAECARALESLIASVETSQMGEQIANRSAAERQRVDKQINDNVNSLKEIAIPGAVKASLDDLVQTKFVPLQYEVQSVQQHSEATSAQVANLRGETDTKFKKIDEEHGQHESRIAGAEQAIETETAERQTSQATSGQSLETVQQQVRDLTTQTQDVAVGLKMQEMVAQKEAEATESTNQRVADLQKQLSEQNEKLSAEVRQLEELAKKLAKQDEKVGTMDELVQALADHVAEDDEEQKTAVITKLQTRVDRIEELVVRLEDRIPEAGSFSGQRGGQSDLATIGEADETESRGHSRESARSPQHDSTWDDLDPAISAPPPAPTPAQAPASATTSPPATAADPSAQDIRASVEPPALPESSMDEGQASQELPPDLPEEAEDKAAEATGQASQELPPDLPEEGEGKAADTKAPKPAEAKGAQAKEAAPPKAAAKAPSEAVDRRESVATDLSSLDSPGVPPPIDTP